MQPLRQIHGARFLNRRRQALGAPGDTRVNGPLPPSRDRGAARLFDLFELVRKPRDPLGDSPHAGDGQSVEHPFPGVVAFSGHGDGHAAERLAMLTARNMQLVNQHDQHVQFAYSSQTGRDPAQPAAELSRDVAVDLQHRHELAKPSRRDTRAMQRRHVAVLERGQRARQAFEPTSKQVGTTGGHDSRFGQALHYS
ncbi:MAG: hypothetical protein AUH43_05860 [Acidobacteria bacterium 13_1_40CM_65_14]|nr:MAG: hypothetical protein AUH43_05860 [Acidobacteria bacterium 13_1_40CM_65_14]